MGRYFVFEISWNDTNKWPSVNKNNIRNPMEKIPVPILIRVDIEKNIPENKYLYFENFKCVVRK